MIPPPPQPQPQPPLPLRAVASPSPQSSNLQLPLPPLPPQPPPTPPSLSTALSNLTSLLHLSTTALRSLPAPICTAAANTATPTFLQCPLNPNHRLPPSSLFSHYLNCPSGSPFQYPLTLQSSTTTATRVSPSTSSSDPSFSLEYRIVNSANFFYENCPGPVTHSTRPPSLLNLPRDLYIECADFSEAPSVKEAPIFPETFIRFLPSEIWTIRSETEAWGANFPAAYSPRILRAILRLKDYNLLHLSDWIVSSSPRYGVIINFPLRDHVVLLASLCLKAIIREAFVTGIDVFRNNNVADHSLECPVLAKMMGWLAFQFSILYGQVNGKLFADDILKECILTAVSHASLFHLEQQNTDNSDSVKADGVGKELVQSISAIAETQINEGQSVKGRTIGNIMIHVSQVVAAVAALHERSLIEGNIQALRNARPISAYERYMEHAYLSKMADEERAKRPEYRPVIEHDGFLWQRSNNQESNKVKTREELLAEERDYKRRRMSYRGKKSKRNTIAVTRDIIEEYMEEIKKASGTGDALENVEKTEALGSDNSNMHASTNNVSELRKHLDIPDENRDRMPYYRKDTSRGDNDFEDGIQRTKQEASRDSGYQDHSKSFDRSRQYTDDYSRRQDVRLHEQRNKSHEHKHHKRNRDQHEEGYNYERERDDHERSSHKRRERHEDKRKNGDKRERKRNNNHSSSHRAHQFDDRYDPAGSREFYEDDF